MKTNNKYVSITPFGDEKERKARMTIEKELTIYTALEIKEYFLNALEKFDEIKVQIKDVENIDLSFLQLIESLRKTAEEYEKKVEISAELQNGTRSLVENSGFDPLLKT